MRKSILISSSLHVTFGRGCADVVWFHFFSLPGVDGPCWRWSITALWSHQLSMDCFNKVEILEVTKKLQLRSCPLMEEVSMEEEQLGEEMTNECLYLRLEELELSKLPDLLQFFLTKHDLEFQYRRCWNERWSPILRYKKLVTTTTLKLVMVETKWCLLSCDSKISEYSSYGS